MNDIKERGNNMSDFQKTKEEFGKIISDGLHNTQTFDEFKIKFRQKCINEIKLAIHGLNEIGIECSFDESTLMIKHDGDN